MGTNALRGALRGAWLAAVVARAQWTYPVPGAPNAPPELSNGTAGGMTVTWEPVTESESYPVDAYRVEALSLQERHKGWQLLVDAVDEASIRNEVQFVNVRVDKGYRVNGGGFWLYLAYDGIYPADTDHTQSVTPEIPWDASADQVKAALEALDTVNVVQVRRCDSAFLPHKAGAQAWVGRCPFGHLGGYTWVIEFERPRTEKDRDFFMGQDRTLGEGSWNERLQKVSKSAQRAGSMPLLGVWKETLSLRKDYRWSGPGGVLEIWRASNFVPCSSTEWAYHDSLLGHDFNKPRPPPPMCVYRAEGLMKPGGLYAFRIAAHNAAGWSAPSPPSAYRRLDAVEPPPRPVAPVWAVASDARFRQGSATLYASRPGAQTASEFAAPAASYDVQYKHEHEESWVDAGRVDADESGWASKTIQHLDVERRVIARVRARNAAGVSSWSGASPAGAVTRDARPPAPSTPSLELDGDEIQVRWLPAAAGATNARSFALQVQTWRGHGFSTPDRWESATAHPISIVETPRTDEVQTVTFRPEDGTFRLRLPVRGSFEKGTLSTELHRGSSGGDVQKALEGLVTVPAGSAAVRRITEGVWRVHFRDPESIAGEDLRAASVFPHLVGESFSGKWDHEQQGPPVLVERTSLARAEALKGVLEAKVRNLDPQTHYRVRAQALDADGNAGDWSDPSDWVQTVDAARVHELSGRSRARAADGSSHALTAVDYRAAFANDPDYVSGAAAGGLGAARWDGSLADTDDGGGGGLVVISAYTGLAAHPLPHSRAVYFASRTAQTYVVPRRYNGLSGARRVVIKAWGGGGGGAGPGRGESNTTSRAAESQTDFLRRDRFWARGGGGGFARASLQVAPGDALEILVGGGGGAAARGKPGAGGWHGGAGGGGGEWGGGGGGGMSLVRLQGHVLIVAGGGGGGGATDYCCAHGGGGGGLLGGNGSAPGLETPVDIEPFNVQRHEHSSAEGDGSGTSVHDRGGRDPRDLVGKPARHRHIDGGLAPGADYSSLATGGTGGALAGGRPGRNGGYAVSTAGVLLPLDSEAETVLGIINKAADQDASVGVQYKGGKGAAGKEGGGGGGGGFFGGGGGGAGVDAAGGGGGSAFVNASHVAQKVEFVWGAERPPQPIIVDANHTGVSLVWPANDFARTFLAERYHVEMAPGVSLEFQLVGVFKVEAGGASIGHLEPETAYRFRLRGANHTDTSHAGAFVSVTTRSEPSDEWTRVHPTPKRYADGGYGRASPVATTPHFSKGDQTGLLHGQQTDDATRAHDAPSQHRPPYPSGRGGHSLTTLGGSAQYAAGNVSLDELGAAFLFGGAGDGYECDGAVGASFRLGERFGYEDADDNCHRRHGALDELWRLDTGMLEWELILPQNNQSWPAPRERHVATVLGGRVAVFGGLRDEFYDHAVAYDDLWLLDVGKPLLQTWAGTPAYTSVDEPIDLPDADVLHFDANVTAGDEWCVRDIDVRIRLEHPCVESLTIELVGPGPTSGSGTYHRPASNSWPVVLMAPDATAPCRKLSLPEKGRVNSDGTPRNVDGDGGVESYGGWTAHGSAEARPGEVYPMDERTGTRIRHAFDEPQWLHFDDGAKVAADDADHPRFGNGGTFRPVDSLSEFEGASPGGTWTLRITDHGGPNKATWNMSEWELVTRLELCERTYTWRHVNNSIGDKPPPRAGALGVSTGDQLFVLGGRNASDAWPTRTLYRYDLPANKWTALTPEADHERAFSPLGKAAVLTPWGVYAYGGLGFGFTQTGGSASSFDGRVHWLDVVNRRWWRDMDVKPRPHPGSVAPPRARTSTVAVEGLVEHQAIVDRATAPAAPRARYRAALAYVEQGLSDHLAAADASRRGSAAPGAPAPPSLVMFGGDDDVADLDDVWLLKLANASLRDPADPRFDLHLAPANHFAFCAWQLQGTAQQHWDDRCGAEPGPGKVCTLRELIQRAYCTGQYQSLGNYPR